MVSNIKVHLLKKVCKNDVQLNLFIEDDSEKKKKLNKAVDLLNQKMGRGALKYAVQGTKKEWKLRQENLSKSFTTNLVDIPFVDLNLS